MLLEGTAGQHDTDVGSAAPIRPMLCPALLSDSAHAPEKLYRPGSMSHALALSPGGHLFVQPDEQAEPKLSQAAAARLTEGFAASPSRGLELLASGFLHEPLPPTFVFWRGLAQRLFTALCHNPDLQNAASISIPKPPEASGPLWPRRRHR